MRQINIYSGILPNDGTNDYYACSASAFEAALLPHLLGSVALPNYRIENMALKLSDIAANAAYRNATYVIEKDDEDASYFRCYKVLSFALYSNMQFFRLELDLWGSYYGKAAFSLFRVRRCNRNVGDGRYDDVPACRIVTNTDYQHLPLAGHEGTGYAGRKYLLPNECYIVFVANVVVAQSIDQTNIVTATHTFATLLSDVRAAFSANVQGSVNLVELAVKYVSGIYKCGTSFWLDNKVEIIKAYIVPAFAMQTLSTLNPLTFTSKTEYDSTEDKDVDFYIVMPKRTIASFSFDVDADFDPDYKYWYGTYDEGIEIDRSTHGYINYFITYFDNDGVRCVIKQADREQDVTNAFEVGISGMSRTSDAGQNIARYIKGFTGLMSEIIAAGKTATSSKTAEGLAFGLGSQANSIIAKAAQEYFEGGRASPSSLVGAGDGATTFAVPNQGHDRVFYPLYYTKIKSTRQENWHAALYGASFEDVRFSNLADIMNYSRLGVSYSRDYVACDVFIEGIPKEAADHIIATLARGVYVKFS